jgi:hypothetical protein
MASDKIAVIISDAMTDCFVSLISLSPAEHTHTFTQDFKKFTL